MISDDLKRVYASGGERTYIEVLRFEHPNFTKTWIMTNQPPADGVTNWTFKDENGATITCLPVPFKVALPVHDGQGRQDLSIVIGNIGRELVTEIAKANENPRVPIKCTLLIYLDQPGTDPQSDPIHLTVTNPIVSDETVTVEASRYDVLNRSFPARKQDCVYNTVLFPGLNR